MLGFLERKGQQVFERYGFSAEGESQAGCPAVRQAKDYQPQVLQTGRVASALEAVCQDMRQRELAEAVVAEVGRQAPAAVGSRRHNRRSQDLVSCRAGVALIGHLGNANNGRRIDHQQQAIVDHQCTGRTASEVLRHMVLLGGRGCG